MRRRAIARLHAVQSERAARPEFLPLWRDCPLANPAERQAFDLIEPERPKVDAAILKFVAENEFAVTDFVLTRDGVCRLSPQLARAVSSLPSG